jgi:hypothetical protein
VELVFWYKNHRGEEGYRRVMPRSIRFGSSQWHPTRQWLLLAFDLEKRADREFAMADIAEVIDAGNSVIVCEKQPEPA